MTSTPPNTVRINSLGSWDHFFHPINGLFRLPNTQGASIDQLHIDLRLVNESPFGTRDVENEIYIPNVSRLTLSGGEFCQDDDKRVDCLVEVLDAINPIEVQWLHAQGPVDNTFSLSTHMVHQAIIRVGQNWSNLRMLTVQGGYPCPNLTAPTPYAVTPAHTPLPSPGLHMRSFSGLQSLAATQAMQSSDKPNTHNTMTIPSYRSKHTAPARVQERAERKRLADYALKPRFEYAFGSWAPEELRWSMDGRYTPAAITTIITNLFKAFSSTFPSSCLKDDRDLPSLLALKPIPLSIIHTLQELVEELGLEHDVIAYLQDVTFISTPSTSSPVKYARLFDEEFQSDDRERLGRRMKAEMHLVNNGSGVEIISLGSLTGVPTPTAATAQQTLSTGPQSIEMTSPAYSCASLATETDLSDVEAVTPELYASGVFEPAIRVGGKSRSASLETAPGERVKSGTNALGMSGNPARISSSSRL